MRFTDGAGWKKLPPREHKRRVRVQINKTTNSGRVKHTLFTVKRSSEHISKRAEPKNQHKLHHAVNIILHLLASVFVMCARSTGIIRVRTRR